jgi:flavin-dependent dehydrogenase
MAKKYDAAVVGTSPAGLAASAILASSGLETIIIDTPQEELLECPLSRWVPRAILKELEKAGMPDVTAMPGAVPFRKIRYHDCSLKKQEEYSSRTDLGCLFPAGATEKCLKKWATDSGARLRRSPVAASIRLEEDHVEVEANRLYCAGILIIADGHPLDVLSCLGKDSRLPRRPISIAALDIPLKRSGSASKDAPPELHVTETPGRNGLGMFFSVANHMHIRVVLYSGNETDSAQDLSVLIGKLQEAGLIPSELALDRAKGAKWHPVAGIALEQEIHEAKRCLLAGPAGGFAECVSGHCLTPSIISGLVAAGVTVKSASRDFHQDDLMAYKKLWRKRLAEYLCPPSTSIPTLLPLLFVNSQLVGKFSKTLLFGGEI